MTQRVRNIREGSPLGKYVKLGKYVPLAGLAGLAGNYFDDFTGVDPLFDLQPLADPTAYPPFYPNFDITTSAPTSASWWEQYGGDVVGAVKAIGTAALTLQQQKELNEANMQRAQRGLSPLSPSQFAPQVNVGMSADTKKMVMFGAIGLGIFLLVNSMGKRGH